MRRGLVWSLLFIVIIAAGALGATIAVGHTPLLGLDLKGGVSVVLQPQGTADSSELNQAVTIIERRVNGLGVSNSEVAVQGKDVVINLPGIKDAQHALAAIGQTAQLFFRPVYCEIPAYVAAGTTTTTAPKTPATTVRPIVTPGTTVPAASATTTTAKAAAGSTVAVPADLGPRGLRHRGHHCHNRHHDHDRHDPPGRLLDHHGAGASASSSSGLQQTRTPQRLPTTTPDQDTVANSVILPVDPKAFPSTPTIRYVLGPADMTGRSVSNATAQIDPTTGQYSVNLTLTSAGAAKFDQIAAQRYACYKTNPSNPPYCSLEAFELDGTVESAPTFQAASFNGSVSITGSFTSSQASALADVLKYGSLPVRFVPQSVQTISATIGKDSLRAGLLAGIGGIIVVMVYMILYYRALGLVVLIGLGVGGALLYSIIAELSQTSNPTPSPWPGSPGSSSPSA